MNIFDLTGKTALITGASSGLGERFARCLSKAGARVILVARRLEKLQVLANELGNAEAVRLDVRERNSILKVFQQLEAAGEKIDICINNAGIFRLTPLFEEEQHDHFEDMLATNLLGVWYITKAVAKHMKKHHIHGSIINIGSVHGANYLHIHRTGYAVSKAAVIHLTKALVGELSPHHIRINCIAPGIVHTPSTAHEVATEDLRKKVEAAIPLGFLATPDHLDGVILYLASNAASSYVTGSCVTLDGGVSWGG